MSQTRSGPPGSRCKGDARWGFKIYVAQDLYRVLETNRAEEQHQPQEPERFHQLAVGHLEDQYQALALEQLHRVPRTRFHSHWRRKCFLLPDQTLRQGEFQERTDHQEKTDIHEKNPYKHHYRKEMLYKHHHHRIRLKPPTPSSRCPTLWCHMGRILSRSRMRSRRLRLCEHRCSRQ